MGNKAKWITVTFLLLTTLVYAQRNKVDTLHTYWIDEVTVTSSQKVVERNYPRTNYGRGTAGKAKRPFRSRCHTLLLRHTN